MKLRLQISFSGVFGVFQGQPHHENYLYNFDPLQPHFYIVKLRLTGVYIIFIISALKHWLWVLVRPASNGYPQSMF